MIAFFFGLLLLAVVIGITIENNDELKIENRKMKNKIRELKRTLKFREYSFISYKGHPLKVVEINSICYNGTPIKDIPVILKVRTNADGGIMQDVAKSHDESFEILIGNKIRTFVVGNFIVDGKVSSLNSYLFPAQTDYDWSGDTVGSDYGASSSGSVYTVENPGIDGAYGQNVTGIFFFTTDGKYIEWTGDFLYSDIPFEVDKPVLNYKEGK